MQKSKKKTSREDFEIEILKKSTLTSAEPKRERLALSLEPKETKRMLLGLE